MASSIPSPSVSRRTAILGSGAGTLLALGGGSGARAADAATLAANKALVERVFAEVVNGGNAQLLHELYAPEFVDRDTSTRHEARPGGMPVTLEAFRHAFPDVNVTIDALVAEGDFVASHESWRDRHPPAGTHLIGRTMHLFRLEGGQIAEQRSAGWEWLRALMNDAEPAAGNPLIPG